MTNKFSQKIRYYTYVLDPVVIFNRVKSYIKCRWVYKNHILSSPKLRAGNWYDLDTRLLYCSFSSLVDFVEVECATSVDRNIGGYNVIKGRDAKAGIKYLENLRDCPDDDDFYDLNTCSKQSANEVLELYTWWTETRPLRPDPWDQYTAEELDDNETSYDLYKKISNLESSYYEEDTEMLVRLMKVRSFLWT